MNSTAFKAQMESGKKFERKIQTLLETHSEGQVFRNVRVGDICEFDVVIEDYPLLTFIEIKRYRIDFAPVRARNAISKFRKTCMRVVNDRDQYARQWVPYNNKHETAQGDVTLFEVLLKKLNLSPVDGWRFRMILIVPDVVYRRVIDSLSGKLLHSRPTNIIDVDGIPLTVMRVRAIETAFG